MTRRPSPAGGGPRVRSWTFLTNHAQVLIAVASLRDARVVEIARAAEITERSAYRILADLQKAGYVRRTRSGRENRYEIHPELPLADPVVGGSPVSALLALFHAEGPGS